MLCKIIKFIRKYIQIPIKLIFNPPIYPLFCLFLPSLKLIIKKKARFNNNIRYLDIYSGRNKIFNILNNNREDMINKASLILCLCFFNLFVIISPNKIYLLIKKILL